jgi:hypothetical protein
MAGVACAIAFAKATAQRAIKRKQANDAQCQAAQLRIAHALAIIAATGSDGATQTLLTAHDFSIRTIAALVKRGLVTIAREKVRTGGRWVDAAKVRVTNAGRDALAAAQPRGEVFGEG